MSRKHNFSSKAVKIHKETYELFDCHHALGSKRVLESVMRFFPRNCFRDVTMTLRIPGNSWFLGHTQFLLLYSLLTSIFWHHHFLMNRLKQGIISVCLLPTQTSSILLFTSC